jgi:chitodextrinase
MDYAYRWQQTSAEYQWLQNDLQTHPSQLKFAVFHYPLYSDNATEPSDTFLQGSNSLEGLLEQNGVNMVFNGHAHLYQHNTAPPGGVVSYVSGGGGATPEPITKCKPLDTYGLGWSAASGGSSCGTAPKPTQIEQVYHYLKVDVNGYLVTVSGVNALGQVFDTTTYNFAPDTTPPTAPSNLSAVAPSGTRVDLTWTASTDAKGVAAYDIYRDGGVNPIATVAGTSTSYSDLTVAQQTGYSYVLRARDPSNNTSDPSNTANVTTPGSDGEAPTAPSNLVAVASSATRVDLTWTASTDNSGVIDHYDIYRDGSVNPIGTVAGAATTYADLTVSPLTPYSYTVRARDASGNTSLDSNVAQVTTPSLGVLFADDFETGTLSTWTTVNGLTVAQGVSSPSGGLWVARETSAGAGATYAYETISPAVNEAYAKFRFQVVSRTGSVDLMRFRNATGGSKVSLYVSGTSNTLSTRNSAGTSTRALGPTIVNGQWYTVELRAMSGAPSVTQVWLDGVHLTELDNTGDIGTSAIGQFLLGTTGSGTYDVVFDDVVVAKNFI